MSVSISGTSGVTFPDATLQSTNASAFKPQSLATTGGTIGVGDKGALVISTGNITIPSNTFAPLDTVSIYNSSNTSSISITQGSGVTLYWTGLTSTGNRTLATNGLASVVFITANTAVVAGGGIT